MGAWDRYVEFGADGLTDDEREQLDNEFQTATEEAADQYRKGES
ncbi:hypothetical protein AB4Z38_06860 [Arthrobacter sp. 2RAF6]